MKLWIARDKDGYLAIYKKEPKLVINQVWVGGCSIWLSSNDFPEVTFENSPKEIELKLVE
jgi:hypothetical protein